MDNVTIKNLKFENKTEFFLDTYSLLSFDARDTDSNDNRNQQNTATNGCSQPHLCPDYTTNS